MPQPENQGWTEEFIDVSCAKVGDTIECPDGVVRTLGANNISRGFMGTSLWGDSYKLGLRSVKRLKPTAVAR